MEQSALAADGGPDAFDWRQATLLPDFLAALPVLSVQDRRCIVDQAILLLDRYYVHLPQKLARYQRDPRPALQALRAGADSFAQERDFHEQLCLIFAELRDLHTQFSLPACYQGHVALLPFKMGLFLDAGQPRFIVTARLESYPLAPENQDFAVDAEVLSWCGQPIVNAVDQVAQRSGGAGAEARRARALATMTVSPMERQPPPARAVIDLTYRGADGDARAASFPYAVVPITQDTTPARLRRFISLDYEGETRRHASKRAYHPRAMAAERQAAAGAPVRLAGDAALPSLLPTVFEARPLGEYGYLRIHSFNPPGIDLPIQDLITFFTDEFVRLLALLPKQGLVLDVRGNGGGFLPLAESILQCLTPHPITPQSLQLLATPSVLALARQSEELARCVPSLEQALAADAGDAPAYSAAFPMTEPGWCNHRGQTYHGPVVLIVDARCYSATDSFAAGFQDHAIGPVLGIAEATGAGGANVWRLEQFPAFDGSGLLDALPGGAGLRVALRRTRRVAPREGVLVEDDGVTPDHRHAPTRADLRDDRDLLARATALLAVRPWYRFDAAVAEGALALTARGIASVRVQAGDWVWSQDLPGGAAAEATDYRLALPKLPDPAPEALRVQGFAGGKLVAGRSVAVG